MDLRWCGDIGDGWWGVIKVVPISWWVGIRDGTSSW